MRIIFWIFFGLLVGGVAKMLSPRPYPRGCLITIALGVAGSLLGGFLGQLLGLYGPETTRGGIFMSILGAAILLAIYRALSPPRYYG